MNNPKSHDDAGLPIGDPVPDWSTRAHPPRTVMQGTYCQVVPLDIELHAVSLYESMGRNPAADWTYLPYGPFDQYTDFKTWLERQRDSDDPLFHVISAAAGGNTSADGVRALGLASYLRIDSSGGALEVGHIHYAQDLQRTPMATEAMFLMMQRVFDELGYRRYEWKCDALNQRSRNAALRLGFSFEGVFRQATVYKNRNRDTAWHSITDSEWPRLKLAYEAWLSADNFDASGGQIQSLAELKN